MQPVVQPVASPTADDAVLRLALVLGRRFRARADGDTVDPSQAAILHVLKHGGAMRLGDLADAMRLDASTVSRHVHQLGEQDLIVREPDPEDGRARIIAISDAGVAALKHTFDRRRILICEAMADWTDAERERLRSDLVRLTEALADL